MTDPVEPGSSNVPERLRADELLGTFNRHGVEFVVVGGFAAVIHGAEVSTVDIDLMVEQSGDNLNRVTDALFELGAVRVTFTDSGMPVPEDGSGLTETVESFMTHKGGVDILREGRTVGGYVEIGPPHAQAVVMAGQQFYVADLDTVIAEKEAADRPKDRIHLLALYDLRETLNAQRLGLPVNQPMEPPAEQQPGRRLDAANASIARAAEKLAAIEQERDDEQPAVVEHTHHVSPEIDHDR